MRIFKYACIHKWRYANLCVGVCIRTHIYTCRYCFAIIHKRISTHCTIYINARICTFVSTQLRVPTTTYAPNCYKRTYATGHGDKTDHNYTYICVHGTNKPKRKQRYERLTYMCTCEYHVCTCNYSYTPAFSLAATIKTRTHTYECVQMPALV